MVRKGYRGTRKNPKTTDLIALGRTGRRTRGEVEGRRPHDVEDTERKRRPYRSIQNSPRGLQGGPRRLVQQNSSTNSEGNQIERDYRGRDYKTEYGGTL